MRLQPSSPELIPTSSPPGLTPAKRPNPTSSPSDLVLATSPTDPNQAKEAKPDNTDLDYADEHLARLYSTPEDRNLPPDEIWSKSTDDFVQAMMEKVPGSGVRSYVVKMFCIYCGAAHLEEDCPMKDTQEAKPILNFPIFRPKTK
ncbi:hypothetical protein ACLB2K_044444 [Fragaria x ananassa]